MFSHNLHFGSLLHLFSVKCNVDAAVPLYMQSYGVGWIVCDCVGSFLHAGMNL
uniref:Uncharacterized protein n=1 Tax=Manihot esculenta TaxID=3983 RepID=A0A2C9VGE3_MANES